MRRLILVVAIFAALFVLLPASAQASFNPPPKPVYAVLIVQQPTVLDCHQPSVPYASPAYCRGNYTESLTDATVLKTVNGFTYRYVHQSVVCVPVNSPYGPWACNY